MVSSTTAAAASARVRARASARRRETARRRGSGGRLFGECVRRGAARREDVVARVRAMGSESEKYGSSSSSSSSGRDAAADIEARRAEIRAAMFDLDDADEEILLDEFGERRGERDGTLARLENAVPPGLLRSGVRVLRNAIFKRFVAASAMMLFVRAGLLLPTRFYSATTGYSSPFSMNSLMSTLSGGASGKDGILGALMGAAGMSYGGAEGAGIASTTLSDSISSVGVPWFHIGIGPFIGASIAMSVLVSLLPELQAMRKDQTGQETIKWWTRLMTFAIAIIQSVLEAGKLKAFSLIGTGFGYYVVVVPMLVTGAMALTWIADEITDYGLGQGSSIIITMSICGGYFDALSALIPKLVANFSLGAVLPFFGFFGVLLLGTVMLEQGTAKVPLEYFQGPTGSGGLPKSFTKDEGGGDHIPFKINPTNMQPVIFAMFLISALQWLPFGFSWVNGQSFGYHFLLFTLVFCGTYIDLQNTPQDISEYIMKIGARVPGVRPGTQTIEYFRRVQAGARFFGGILLATIATVCSLCDLWIAKLIGQPFGLTSMLIVVSTVISIKRQIQAMSQMPKLDQVLKTL
jgi:preprotein translocase subunit SecY